MRYNKPGTPYYKAAQRIQSNSATVLAELNNLRTSAPSELLAHNETMVNGLVQPGVSTMGDLEPPLDLVDLLVSPDIADELSIVFRTDPLQFLLAYELPEFRLRPMAPVQPTVSSRKNKRERKAKSGKKRAVQHVVAPVALATEADTEMAMFGSSALNSTHFQAMSAAVAETDPATTPTATMTLASPGPEVDSEAEQVLGKRKRTKPAGTDAEVLTDINPKASFALFDKGWILDPGVRRGGRARVERLPELLTKKRPKSTCVFRNWIVNSEETKCLCIH
jgi:NuA3 HAT complex component NTO1